MAYNMTQDKIGDCSFSESSSEDDYSSDKYKMTYSGYRSKSKSIVARPQASPGFWMCGLFPAVFLAQYLGGSNCSRDSPNSSMLSIASLGMCVESLCFFMYMFLDTSLLLKLVMSFVPGSLTSVLFTLLLKESWLYGIFWGFAVTLCYQNVYIRVMRGLPRCFSFGEAAVVVQGLTLFVLNSLLHLPTFFSGGAINAIDDVFQGLNAIVIFAMFALVFVCFALAIFPSLRQPLPFYLLMGGFVLAATCAPVTRPLPLCIVLKFVFGDGMRLHIIALYLTLVGLSAVTVWLQLRYARKASSAVRKIFHILIVLVYLPGMIFDCNFLYLASAVAFAMMLVLELMRILNIPPISRVLNNAFVLFSDEKDVGGLSLTPFSLLIGCTLPLWISRCPCPSTGAAPHVGLTQLAGILALGFGDTAASVIGSTFGRIKWRGTHRSLEGTIAFIVSVILAIVTLSWTSVIQLNHIGWVVTIVAVFVTSLVEAQTDQIDNLALPLIFYAIVCLA